MSAELPEGMDIDDVRAHAMSLGFIGALINLTSTFLTAEDGSAEESEAEDALDEYLERVLDMGAEVAGKLLLTFASLIVQVADQESVQAWFNDQASRIGPYLAEAGLMPEPEEPAGE
ncbi:hypothetical protein HOT42_gp52 [Microbacterium phage Metamorphoo]|uniref:Uncharacterized protein n=1 Tax=Microbacterium phage Metamorphoo TaxID=2201437 RepID=A0A2Z4Q7E2_9CAUD|nr:hypothetical protein HOT42_gp52 [Microbacterium phage Metamorphoo]AWY05403.1 hypothetical protein SEA_METAMORPHOO_52 [Microbacterium phage Metamorphoo]